MQIGIVASLMNHQFSVTTPVVFKSRYNFGSCPACGNLIKRGDLVTKVKECRGMLLRSVVWKNGSFNSKYTGERVVHKNCSIDGFWTDYSAEECANSINGYFDSDDDYNEFEILPYSYLFSYSTLNDDGWSIYDSPQNSPDTMSELFWSD